MHPCWIKVLIIKKKSYCPKLWNGSGNVYNPVLSGLIILHQIYKAKLFLFGACSTVVYLFLCVLVFSLPKWSWRRFCSDPLQRYRPVQKCCSCGRVAMIWPASGNMLHVTCVSESVLYTVISCILLSIPVRRMTLAAYLLIPDRWARNPAASISRSQTSRRQRPVCITSVCVIVCVFMWLRRVSCHVRVSERPVSSCVPSGAGHVRGVSHQLRPQARPRLHLDHPGTHLAASRYGSTSFLNILLKPIISGTFININQD